jgi:transposase-like protein
MTKARFTEKFKQEAIKQVLERGYTVPDVASSNLVPRSNFICQERA